MDDLVTKQSALNDDLLWGAASIGREIGRTRQQVYYLMLCNGEWPAC